MVGISRWPQKVLTIKNKYGAPLIEGFHTRRKAMFWDSLARTSRLHVKTARTQFLT